jgi:hypothetical protein
MPEFETYVDVDVDEFISVCSKREIKRLIECLVEEDHLPESVLSFKEEGNEKRGRMESEFIEKLDRLKDKYYSLSVEEEDSIEKIFKKHL